MNRRASPYPSSGEEDWIWGFSISWEVVLFFALGMALLYGVGWLLLVPFKKGLYFLFNSLVGGLLLWWRPLWAGTLAWSR